MNKNEIILGIDAAISSDFGYCFMNNNKEIILSGVIKMDGGKLKHWTHLEKGIYILNELDKLKDQISVPLERIKVYMEENKICGKGINATVAQNFLMGLMVGRFRNRIILISPHVWRKTIYLNSNPNKLKREALKALAIKTTNKMYETNITNDNIAEAILIARFGVINE